MVVFVDLCNKAKRDIERTSLHGVCCLYGYVVLGIFKERKWLEVGVVLMEETRHYKLVLKKLPNT